MYPTGSVPDYMTEINRLNTRNGGNVSEMFRSPTQPSNAPTNTSIGSFNQSMARSSSTDTSPDSFPDLTAHQFHSEFFQPELEAKTHFYQRTALWNQDQYDQFQPEHSFETPLRRNFETRMEHLERDKRCDGWMHSDRLYETQIPRNVRTEHETPVTVRRQRPIIGRKIMARPDTQALKTVDEFNPNLMWQPDNLLQTPPRSFEQKYELFPTEHRGFEFPSPVSQHISPNLTVSPRTVASLTPPPKSPFSWRMSTPFKEPFVGPTPSYTSYGGSSKMCTFCKKNGETPLVYMTHTVKEKVGNKNVVTCPILRSHVCMTCGASGGNAHTITYCPVLRSGNNGQPLQSTTITLKNTRVKSNGRRRY